MPVELKRGVNNEGWLHQPAETNPWHFATQDVALLARLGFDHVRINVGHEHLWDSDDKPIARTFDMIDALLDDCSRLGLKAVFDLHTCPFFRDRNGEVHFHEPESLPLFLKAWRRLSAHLRRWPCTMLVYEFFNEPTANDSEDWNRLAEAVHRMLRDLEPDRTFMLGSNGWGGPPGFEHLRVPDDCNLILSFHFYSPFHFTHYRVSDEVVPWTVQYPGHPISNEGLATMSEEQRELTLRDNPHYDRALLRERMSIPINVARNFGLPLHCGEFGCFDNVPRPDRLRWHTDMISIFNEEGIGWASYAYRNRWGTVIDRDGRRDEELTGILLDN